MKDYTMFFTYLLLGGFASVLYRAGAKINKVDPIIGIIGVGIMMTIIGTVLFFIIKPEFKFTGVQHLLGVSVTAIGSVIGTMVIMYAMKDGLPMSTFLVSYQIFSMAMVMIIGILFFKEQINIYQGMGIVTSLISIYLLMQK